MFHMMKNVSESLAGRVGIVNLFGLSQSEIAGIASEEFTTAPDRLLSRLEKTSPMTKHEVYERKLK
jgi:predicted AAA+ superfamily ATPase